MKKYFICLLVGLMVAIFTSPVSYAGGRDMANEILSFKEPKATAYTGSNVNTRDEILMERIEKGFRNLNGRLDKMEAANKKRDEAGKKRDGRLDALEKSRKKTEAHLARHDGQIKGLGERIELWGNYISREFNNIGDQIYRIGLAGACLFIIVLGILVVFARTLRPRPRQQGQP